jgi:hypothetical protein
VKRRRVDFEEVRRQLAGRCFICELLAGNQTGKETPSE